MKNAMSKIRAGQDKGLWIPSEVRETLEAHWAGEQFKAKSVIGKHNRSVDSGASLYTGGSVSTAVHRHRMVSINYFDSFILKSLL